MTSLEFGRWYSPEEAVGLARTEPDLVHARRSKGLREAWILGKVGQALGVKRLIFSKDNTFDGAYELDGTLRQVEITELLDDGRRRGDEDPDDIRVQSVPINTEDFRLRIVDAIGAKAERNKKRFENSGLVDLIIYFNLFRFDNVDEQIQEGIRLGFCLEHPFSRVYVLDRSQGVIFGNRTKEGLNILKAKLEWLDEV